MLTLDMKSVQFYEDAVLHSVPANTTINMQLISAIHGNYAHYVHPAIKSRVDAPDMYITPLMSMFWFFDFDVVFRWRLFMDRLVDATSMNDVERIYFEERVKLKLIDKYNGAYKGTKKFNQMFLF
eukprot:TRINITY_DN3721_c0_g1_i1.p1 TRINITY_DN3721_c0_g1~~TRINITY_DN3721_c0_g1_i1.p1  ORF type:complete len:125 (-),score=38.85 TRINITY_DN3721_c0_g1_i1:83-457(-)